MNNLRNSVRLVGRLGTDPEVYNFENGKKKVRFSLATTEAYKDKDGKRVENTQWHNIVAWGAQAAFLEKYVQKGREIAIEGKLIHRSYEDSSGSRKYITEIVVNETLLMGRPANQGATA